MSELAEGLAPAVVQAGLAPAVAQAGLPAVVQAVVPAEVEVLSAPLPPGRLHLSLTEQSIVRMRFAGAQPVGSVATGTQERVASGGTALPVSNPLALRHERLHGKITKPPAEHMSWHELSSSQTRFRPGRSFETSVEVYCVIQGT